MTIWALALLASLSHATVVSVKGSARPAPVTAVPAVSPILGGGMGTGVSLGNVDLRGVLNLPAPAPGLTNGLPAASFVPPGAMQFKKIDAQAVAAPLSAPEAAPQAQAESDAARPLNGLVPEEPALGASRLTALPARSAGDAARAGLVPALGARAALGSAAAPLGEEAAASAGRVLFDEAASRAAVDVSRFAAPMKPAPAARAGLRPYDAEAQKAWFRALAGPDADVAAPAERTGYAPDASLVATRMPLPGSVVDVALRDAVASPRVLPADASLAGLRGGHAPLLARPSRLTLAGEGLVVRVSPVPGADALLRGRPSWTVPLAPAAPATARPRLVSTELIERGALREAVSAAEAAAGRGLLGGLDAAGYAAAPVSAAAGRGPGADGTPARPSRRAPVSSTSWLLLSVLPLAAYAASRRFL